METRRPDGGQILLPPDRSLPDQLETATFALGCFWGPDARFGILPGVIRTRVGYAGGTKKNPTYHDLGDHTESLQIDYDPSVIDYRDLLEHFWQNHDPRKQTLHRQYMNAVFHHDEQQLALIEESLSELEEKTSGSIETRVDPLEEFYRAEDYHQKYRLRREPELMREFSGYSPDEFADSTVAAKLNGYLYGYGSGEQLDDEVDAFGLSERGEELLRRTVARSG